MNVVADQDSVPDGPDIFMQHRHVLDSVPDDPDILLRRGHINYFSFLRVKTTPQTKMSLSNIFYPHSYN